MLKRKHFKIFTVFSFLRLKSPDISWYQFVYPTLIAIIIYGNFLLLDDTWVNFQLDKIIESINSLMGILVGFYIAALAAVSSFSNDNLDQVMKGRSPTLSSNRRGNVVIEKLTRRRFLSILFGYCAILAIFIYLFGILYSYVSINIFECCLFLDAVITTVRSFVYLWALSSLLVTTLLGLHYLVERMHRA